MTLVIILPRSLEGSTFRMVTAQAPRLASAVPDKIEIDFSKLQFITPIGVTYLNNLINWLSHHGCEVVLSYDFEDIGPALKFLDDSLFFQTHVGKKLRPMSSPRPTTRPLQEIAHQDSRAWLDLRLMPWLSSTIDYTRASLHVFQTCIAEIFNNIRDHSEMDIGCIFVQHFPNKQRVNISIADFGVGIPNTVRKVQPGLTDVRAIIQAVQQGFTASSSPGNRGIGLDYLLNAVVRQNEGGVTIFSLDGAVGFFNSRGQICVTKVSSSGFCPGTTFDIWLRTDKIIRLEDEEEDLEW
jgi:anti-sigma regulatory factor (Ser/Thr protein kinase)